jgi:selenocysteine lyase/cysteine desulfurase
MTVEPTAPAPALAAAATAAAANVHVPGPGPYLLTHSVGPMPRSAEAVAREAFFAPWAERGSDAWGEWLARVDAFRGALAALLGGRPADWCPQPNLSAALAKLLPALPARADRPVWVAAEDSFPSLGYVLALASRLGIELRLIPRSASPADPATWAAALGPDVHGALVTHVHSNTGVVAPVAEVAALCRHRGVWCVADVAQSAGILPVRVEAFGADVVLGSCVKWLCGGPGAGFMWVDPARLPELAPIDVGWFSHEAPFEMDIHAFRYAPDARRFWGGTPSILPYAVATEGLRFVARTGIQTILGWNRTLARQFLASAPAAVADRAVLDGRGGTLCLPVGDAVAAVRAALERARIRFDTRGPVVRLSFHVCNSVADAALAGDAWPR